MDYRVMSDDDILWNLAMQMEKLRLSKHIKESEIVATSGISRKTLYNFKQGATAFTLKNFIRLLRSMDELNRLQQMFPEKETYSPRKNVNKNLARRVRDKKNSDKPFQWGDEQ